jgi:hypothetical protein
LHLCRIRKPVMCCRRWPCRCRPRPAQRRHRLQQRSSFTRGAQYEHDRILTPLAAQTRTRPYHRRRRR